MHAFSLNCQITKLAVSDLEPIALGSLSLHTLLDLAGRRDVALDIGGRGALWGTLDRAWIQIVSRLTTSDSPEVWNIQVCKDTADS